MARHVLGIAAATLAVLLLTVRPFLPGAYDPLAVPLAAMARVFGVMGLLLVPVGALWTVADRRRWTGRRRSTIRMAALAAAALVWLAVSLAGLVFGGASLGVASVACGVVAGRVALRRLSGPEAAVPDRIGVLPVAFLVVPIAVAVLQAALVGRAVEYSIERVIGHAAPLIADLERYRAARGSYPPSLLSVWEDYSPSVVGVQRFQYEPSGGAYNLAFEQFRYPLATRAIVVYNPVDGQEMTSHNTDLLRFAGGELQRRRGYYAVEPVGPPHWKMFLFD
jgi:hypothetical protein